jgi:hypothetical protein
MKEAIKNDKLEGRIRNLVNEYEKLQRDFYRATFKVPEIDVVKNDKRK